MDSRLDSIKRKSKAVVNKVKKFIAFGWLIVVLLSGWSYYLDSWWDSEFRSQVQQSEQLGYTEGYWRGFYDLCMYETLGNELYCNYQARRGYRLEVHNRTTIEGFNWTYIRLGNVY